MVNCRISSSSSSCCVGNRLPLLLPPFLLLVGLFLLISSTDAQAQQSSPFPSGPEKQAHLHFFFHDILSNPNPTAIQIISSPSGGGFGDVVMVDNPLTETSDPSSTLLGRAQGFYASASQSETAFLMTMNYVFFGGEFNGSTLAILGRNPVMESVREMSVVGGSGKLRMASGYALARTRSFGPGGNAVVEYDVYVVYSQNPGSGEVITTVPGGGAGGTGGTGGRGLSSGASGGPSASWLVVSAAVALSWVPLMSTRV